MSEWWKLPLIILASIGAFNTFYAYGAAIDNLDKEDISKKWIYVFIIMSFIGICCGCILIVTK